MAASLIPVSISPNALSLKPFLPWLQAAIWKCKTWGAQPKTPMALYAAQTVHPLHILFCLPSQFRTLYLYKSHTEADLTVEKWYNHVVEGATIVGKDFCGVKNYKRYMEEAGFVNVEEKSFVWPINTWPKDPHLKKLGLWWNHDLLDLVEGLNAPFTRGCMYILRDSLFFVGWEFGIRAMLTFSSGVELRGCSEIGGGGKAGCEQSEHSCL